MKSAIIFLIVAIVLVVAVFVVILFMETRSRTIRQRDLLAMNRQVMNYENSGWLVIVNVKKRLVGLYKDSHSVSHDRIMIGKDTLALLSDGHDAKLTIGDFRKLSIDIPRRSYRVLYEYKVPHETPVIFY